MPEDRSRQTPLLRETLHASTSTVGRVTGHALDTVSGVRLDLDNPRPEQIRINDIAAALSKICRFGAQATSFYSVAQHAVLVSSLVQDPVGPELALAALHHDSHEAFVCDLPTPLKARIDAASNGYYQRLCDRLDLAIDGAFGITGVRLDAPRDEAIKRADRQALLMESRELLHDGGRGLRLDRAIDDCLLDGLPPLGLLLDPPEAEAAFLSRHEALQARRT